MSVNGEEITVRHEVRASRSTYEGLFPVTDVFVAIDGRHIYSRHYGEMDRGEVIAWVEGQYGRRVRKMQGRDLPGHGGH